MATKYDAIIIGGGHNGLVCAAYLARSGRSVLGLEAANQVGGAVLDTRPLMVSAMSEQPKTKWGWTANVGGADFLGNGFGALQHIVVDHDAAGVVRRQVQGDLAPNP